MPIGDKGGLGDAFSHAFPGLSRDDGTHVVGDGRVFRTPPGWSFNLPAVDIEETDDAYVVTAEVPGFDKKDIEVELHNDVLVIRGKREREEGRRFLRRERTWSSTQFQRMLQLPAPSILTV